MKLSRAHFIFALMVSNFIFVACTNNNQTYVKNSVQPETTKNEVLKEATNLTASVESNHIKLTWTNNTANGDHIHVQRKTKSGFWQVNAVFYDNRSFYIDNDTRINHTYEYRLLTVKNNKNLVSKTITHTLMPIN